MSSTPASQPTSKNQNAEANDISLWIVIPTFGLLAIGVATAVSVAAQGTVWRWAPYITIAAGAPFAVLLFRNQAEKTFKQAKSILDTSWNIWSSVGAVVLMNRALGWSKSLEQLMADLNDLGPGWSTLVAIPVVVTACGRISISITEFWNARSPRPKS
jgi:hypothetical protein